MYKLLHDNTDSFVIMISKVNDANPNAVMRLLNTVVSINSDIGFALTYDDRSSIGRNNRIFANTSDGTSAVIRNISADSFFGTQQYNLLFSKNDPQNLTASQRNVLTTNNLLTSENNSLTGVTSTSISSYNLYIGSNSLKYAKLKGANCRNIHIRCVSYTNTINRIKHLFNKQIWRHFPDCIKYFLQ